MLLTAIFRLTPETPDEARTTYPRDFTDFKTAVEAVIAHDGFVSVAPQHVTLHFVASVGAWGVSPKGSGGVLSRWQTVKPTSPESL